MKSTVVLAVARAEARSIRRLTRYWVFTVLALLIGCVSYLQMAFMHGTFSRYSATVGAMGPRYIIASQGFFLLTVYLLGLIFLAFDVRARDERARMAEVLDSRPVSNAEFVLGRCVGVVLMSWLPMLGLGLVLESIGFLALLNDWPIGEPLEPWSSLGFLLQSLTAMSLWCAVIVLIAVVVRNRLVVAVVALGLLALQFWLTFELPLYLIQMVALQPMSDIASDVAPLLMPPGGETRQMTLWCYAGAALAAATALYPRRDASRSRTLALGAGLLVLAIAGSAAQYWQLQADRERRAGWLEAHRAYRGSTHPDLAAVQGTVRLDPGHAVALDLVLHLQTTPAGSTDELIFTLNPGLTVSEVVIDGAVAPWSHRAGLLKIDLSRPLPPASQVAVALRAEGRPLSDFGYLDTAFDILEGRAMNAQLAVLGTEVTVFTGDYVALMPGGDWYPRVGSDVPNADPRTRADDYFTVDLEVDTPHGWLVAGPGRRQELEPTPGRTRFRFHPDAPIPDMGLLASRFERRAVEIAGIEFELLLHPGHDRNLAFFADAADELEKRLGELVDGAKRLGLPYPYGGLSLVEIPNRLRGYGGGWRMDTVLTMPGMLLVRESSFPSARFEAGFENPDAFEGREGGIAAAKVDAIERFFENDFSGGNLFTGVSRQFLRFQTGARGDGAIAIDFVLDELVSQLLTDKRGYFSAHEFTQQVNLLIGQTIQDITTGRTDSVADAIMRATTSRPSVWDRALGSSLADLDPGREPRQALNVFALKGRAIARSILDGFGRERTAAWLALLLNRYRGTSFSVDEFERAALDAGLNLRRLLGDWLHETALPGFLASPVHIERLTDDNAGNPRYQTTVHLRNDEPAPGLVRLSYVTKSWQVNAKKGRRLPMDHTGPLRMAGNQSIEVGIVTMEPPAEIWLEPYLALNRDRLRLELPSFDQEARGQAAPFVGSRPSGWQPAHTGDVIVDDLDDGFSTGSDRPPDGSVSLGGPIGRLQGLRVDLDRGLPVHHWMFGMPQVWSRLEESSAWGKYRHTYAAVTNTNQPGPATFTASLPESGRWRLAYYVPAALVKGNKATGAQDIYDLHVIAETLNQTIEFDGSGAESGWNDLGEFELPAGQVQVGVSSSTAARMVVADAIRWHLTTSDGTP